ncbi:MAG: MarR family winged helix-turn-helix transcriptional regulator [Hymenobacter sp.]
MGEVAQALGHTHAAVSQVVKELVKHDLVRTERGPADLRRSIVTLTAKGPACGRPCRRRPLTCSRPPRPCWPKPLQPLAGHWRGGARPGATSPGRPGEGRARPPRGGRGPAGGLCPGRIRLILSA